MLRGFLADFFFITYLHHEKRSPAKALTVLSIAVSWYELQDPRIVPAPCSHGLILILRHITILLLSSLVALL
jgi:hypothetical protein